MKKMMVDIDIDIVFLCSSTDMHHASKAFVQTQKQDCRNQVKSLLMYTKHGPGPRTTSVDPVHGPPHGPPLAEHVFRQMHVETMEEGEITHCFLNFWIHSFVNILRSIRGRYILLSFMFLDMYGNVSNNERSDSDNESSDSDR